MSFAQGEVILQGKVKVVYIQMNRTRYTAVDINDATKSYSCKGGKSTGEFRPDLVTEHFANQQVILTKKVAKEAVSFQYKALAIGKKITLKSGRVAFVLKHKRTKLLSMDLQGQVWDSHYGAIIGVPVGTIKNENLEVNRKFEVEKELN